MGATGRGAVCAWGLASIIGALACSGASGAPAGHGSSSGGSSSSGGGSGSSSSATDDSGGGSGDDAASSSSGGSTLNTSGWTCPSDTVFSGYSPGCVTCLETMCLTPLTQCMTSACTACEGPVFTCETQSCQSACAAGGASGDAGGSSGASGDGGAATGTCAGLMRCCTLAASISAMLGASCTSVAQSGNEASCQSAIASLPATLSPYCM